MDRSILFDIQKIRKFTEWLYCTETFYSHIYTRWYCTVVGKSLRGGYHSRFNIFLILFLIIAYSRGFAGILNVLQIYMFIKIIVTYLLIYLNGLHMFLKSFWPKQNLKNDTLMLKWFNLKNLIKKFSQCPWFGTLCWPGIFSFS